MRLTEAEYDNIIKMREAKDQTSRERHYKQIAEKESAAPARSIIRQSSKGLNKTEIRFLNEYLKPLVACGFLDEIGDHESIQLKLANGLRLNPDFPTWAGGKLTFYEVKGSRVWEDSLVKLKVAANKFRHFRFVLCKYSKGEWVRQEVLP